MRTCPSSSALSARTRLRAAFSRSVPCCCTLWVSVLVCLAPFFASSVSMVHSSCITPLLYVNAPSSIHPSPTLPNPHPPYTHSYARIRLPVPYPIYIRPYNPAIVPYTSHRAHTALAPSSPLPSSLLHRTASPPPGARVSVCVLAFPRYVTLGCVYCNLYLCTRSELLLRLPCVVYMCGSARARWSWALGRDEDGR